MADVTVCLVYPDALGTYGDGGNARILAQRLRWRGIGAEVLTVPVGTPLPAMADLYVLGGGEDRPQSLAAAELRREGTLAAAAARGAAVLAVCAGLQVIGTRFLTGDGLKEGAGLVDVATEHSLPVRAVGELVVDASAPLGRLSGYENHAGASTLGPGVQPLGAVSVGVGNGGPGGTDGFIAGKVLGTYLHGPVLARNPDLADLLLSWVVGDAALAPLDDTEALDLREERLGAAGDGGRRGRARA